MRRRALLGAGALTALSGCLEKALPYPLGVEESDEVSERDPSTPERAGSNEWEGGLMFAEREGAVIETENGRVSVAGAMTSQRIGVTTTETDEPGSELEDSEFRTYEASNGSYFWVFQIGTTADYGEEVSWPASETWSAMPQGRKVDDPIKCLSDSLESSPTFYRLPYSKSMDETVPAYGYDGGGIYNPVLAFEVPSRSVALQFGRPARFTFRFEA